MTRWAGDDLQVHPVLAVLAGIERPAGRHPVDGDQGAVDDQVGVPGLGRVAQRLAQLGGSGGQQRHGLGDVPPGGGGGGGGGGADAEAGRQFGERLAFAQVGQHQQRLPARGELAPGRADLPAVAADDPGAVDGGLARQWERGRAEKHLEPSVADADLGRSLHLPGASP